MLTTTLAALAISLALTVAQAPQAQDPRAEAERLARAGEHAEALRRFQEIVTANPSDIQSRLWIGRLQLALGEAGRAVAVFESIVATDPQNVDALVGLGQGLTARGRAREAADALNRAEALAPDRVDVLAAQGALHASEGRVTLGLAYYARALALDPTNQSIRDAVDTVRAERAHRIEASYDFQHFNTAREDNHAGTVVLNARMKDTLRLIVMGQTHRNFLKEQENRGGGGIEWMPRSRLRLSGGGVFGASAVELPSLDLFGSAGFREGRTEWGVDLRIADFDGADFVVGGPTLAIRVTDRWTGYLAYRKGRVRFDVSDQSSATDSFTVGARGTIRPRMTAMVEYHRGIERLEWLTIDRLAANEANTITVGATYDATPYITLGGRYDHQTRPDDVTIQRGSARFLFRF